MVYLWQGVLTSSWSITASLAAFHPLQTEFETFIQVFCSTSGDFWVSLKRELLLCSALEDLFLTAHALQRSINAAVATCNCIYNWNYSDPNICCWSYIFGSGCCWYPTCCCCIWYSCSYQSCCWSGSCCGNISSWWLFCNCCRLVLLFTPLVSKTRLAHIPLAT